MTATIEAEPTMYPTIIRRVHRGALETVERRVEGRAALCVWWSLEHAEEHMRENGFPAEEGWKAVERDHEELATIFGLLRTMGTMELVFVEPPPEDPTLGGVFEPDTFIAMLEESLED